MGAGGYGRYHVALKSYSHGGADNSHVLLRNAAIPGARTQRVSCEVKVTGSEHILWFGWRLNSDGSGLTVREFQSAADPGLLSTGQPSLCQRPVVDQAVLGVLGDFEIVVDGIASTIRGLGPSAAKMRFFISPRTPPGQSSPRRWLRTPSSS
jgi:hypothetical protein